MLALCVSHCTNQSRTWLIKSVAHNVQSHFQLFWACFVLCGYDRVRLRVLHFFHARDRLRRARLTSRKYYVIIVLGIKGKPRLVCGKTNECTDSRSIPPLSVGLCSYSYRRHSEKKTHPIGIEAVAAIKIVFSWLRNTRFALALTIVLRPKENLWTLYSSRNTAVCVRSYAYSPIAVIERVIPVRLSPANSSQFKQR